jgi:predicted dehydrogenase
MLSPAIIFESMKSDLHQTIKPCEKTPLRLGIIGLGIIGQQHWLAARHSENIEIVTIAEPQLPNLNGDLKNIAVTKNWRELLEYSELDAVSVCVPHHLHAEIVRAALEAGKHVLVEKPLAFSCVQGTALAELASTLQRVLMVEMTHRFYPPVCAARAMVRSGVLGELYAVQDRIIEPVGAQIPHWMKNRKLAGGGVALTNGIHMLDRVAFVTGEELVFETGRAGYGAHLGDIENAAMMQLHLKQSGVPAQLLMAWPRGDATSDNELTLYGSAATLRVWAWRGWRLEPINGKTPAREELCYAPHDDLSARVRLGVCGALEEFATAIREQRAPRPNAAQSLAAQRLVEEFYQSL